WGTPSTTSSITTVRARFFSARRCDAVAPTLPAPTTATFSSMGGSPSWLRGDVTLSPGCAQGRLREGGHASGYAPFAESTLGAARAQGDSMRTLSRDNLAA